ncbi:MAG: hypothetical protein J6O88_11845 [Chryseobacterium sp.]|uniref:hypothetical protein n=2 Tax=unclassified Chryseobacterium TaxID=2593645 RepID=UPI001B1C2EDD|nr:hypothetical protein [Chryseobacterium sp.]MBO6185360.1 hypothetical protein [Chryseobacterium sp.]
MKKLYTSIGLFLATLLSAQVPQAFSYQTIAFNASGAPIANGNVALKISILENSATGTVLYTETHNKTTNSKGLVNLNIGQGTATTGTFGGINWGTNTKFVKVEMDPAGGSNYTNVGVNQLMSVPYALVADKINLNSDNSTFNEDLIENKSANFAIYNYGDGKTYVYNSKTGTWSGQTGGGTGTNYVVASNGNFVIYNYGDGKTYAYNSKTGMWSGQTGGGTGTNYVVASNGNFAIYNYGDGKTYVFNSKIGTWSAGQNGGGTGTNYVVAGNGNFAIYNYGDGKTYVYNSKTNIWSGQNGGGTGTNYVVTSESN